MKYMSTKEAAEKWGVSLRNVQRLLAEKRIDGAKKYGVSWLVPADAEKPGDPRRERGKKAERAFYTLPRKCPLLTLTTLYSTPGGDAAMDALAYDEDAQILFCSQLAYMRGDIVKALETAKKLPLDEARPDLFI